MNTRPADWTSGDPRIVYRRCLSCDALWYFPREFCPACGGTSLQHLESGGAGTVHALTRVARAPGDAWRPFVPYTIALVDVDEGFRMMAHLAGDAAIGSRVRATFRHFGDVLVPVFVPE